MCKNDGTAQPAMRRVKTSDLKTARGLFWHLFDPANPPGRLETYRTRLVKIPGRPNDRPGSRTIFTADGLIALEAPGD